MIIQILFQEKSSKSKNVGSPGDASSPSSVTSSHSVTPPSQSKDKSSSISSSSSHRSTATVSSSSSSLISRGKTAPGAGVIPSKEKAAQKRPAESSPSSTESSRKKRNKDSDAKTAAKEKKHKSSHSHRHSHSSHRSDKKKPADGAEEVSKPERSHSLGFPTSQKASDQKKVVVLSDGEISEEEEDLDVGEEVDNSPVNVVSLLGKASNGGPLNALWDEIKGDDDSEMLSPLPRSSPPNLFSHDSMSSLHSPSKRKSQPNGTSDFYKSYKNNNHAANGETFEVLLDLQRRLLSVTDRDLLHRIVRVVQDTHLYQISDATFDFDLCSLDQSTVKKLQTYLDSQML